MPRLTDLPVIDVGGRSGRLEPALDLRLLSGSQLFINIGEVRRVVRHRYMLANFVGLTIPGIALLYALDSKRIPIDMQVPAVVVGLVAAQALLMVYLRSVVAVARVFHREARIIRIWVTPGMMLGAAALLAAVSIMHHVLEVQQDWTELQSKLIPFFCVLYLELCASFIFRGALPRALADLRGGVDPFADMADGPLQDDGPVAEAAGAVTEQAKLPQGGDLLIRLGIAPADILRAEASGNYVTIVTRTGRHLVPGPFSGVVAQMPATLGRQVQRSHWVALAAVEGVRKQGREIWLDIAGGGRVPVSAALKSEVQAWLDGRDKARPVALRDLPDRPAQDKVA